MPENHLCLGELFFRNERLKSSYPQIAGLAKALRSYRLLKPPSIREILKLAQVLRDRGCSKITPDMRDTLLPFLVKTAEDREKMLLTHNFNRLSADAAKHAREFLETRDEMPSTISEAELMEEAAA